MQPPAHKRAQVGPQSRAAQRDWTFVTFFQALLLSLVIAQLALMIVFWRLEWVEDVILTGLLVFPIALPIAVISALPSSWVHPYPIVRVLPVVLTPLLAAAGIWLLHGWVETQLASLNRELATALEENAFFLTAALWRVTTWETFFLAVFLIVTFFIDLILVPFVVVFDPDVVAQFVLLLLRILCVTLAGAAAAALVWGPIVAVKKKWASRPP